MILSFKIYAAKLRVKSKLNKKIRSKITKTQYVYNYLIFNRLYYPPLLGEGLNLHL